MDLLQWITTQPGYLLWVLVGVLLLAVTLLVFEPTIVALGVAAMITGVAAFTVRDFGLQLLLWGVLSICLSAVLRAFVPRESRDLRPPSKAEVSISIPAGGEGEVTYEGTFWSARCQVSDVAIAAGSRVFVLGRQGNTLIVMPETPTSPSVSDRKV